MDHFPVGLRRADDKREKEKTARGLQAAGEGTCRQSLLPTIKIPILADLATRGKCDAKWVVPAAAEAKSTWSPPAPPMGKRQCQSPPASTPNLLQDPAQGRSKRDAWRQIGCWRTHTEDRWSSARAQYVPFFYGGPPTSPVLCSGPPLLRCHAATSFDSCRPPGSVKLAPLASGGPSSCCSAMFAIHSLFPFPP